VAALLEDACGEGAVDHIVLGEQDAQATRDSVDRRGVCRGLELSRSANRDEDRVEQIGFAYRLGQITRHTQLAAARGRAGRHRRGEHHRRAGEFSMFADFLRDHEAIPR
jgi:hypothetical protein